MKTLKFGGTSMADGAAIKKVIDIIKSDKEANYIVVSAPGVSATCEKVTDLLLNVIKNKDNFAKPLERVKERFSAIVNSLNIKFDLDEYFVYFANDIKHGVSVDYIVSRGEHLSAMLLAKALDYDFVDAKDIIKFDAFSNFDAELTNEICGEKLRQHKNAVIPGFYGALPNGEVKTFSRGGSDITGAIAARAVSASVYENFTDVDGFCASDPRIIKDAGVIEMLTYEELRELSYMGASVLHSMSIFPVRHEDIPIHIRNTFNPKGNGTFIVPTKKFKEGKYSRKKRAVTGIAGKKEFLGINIEKSLMNEELGFGRRILSVFEKYNVSFEHMPGSIDTLSIIIDGNGLEKTILNRVVAGIINECNPDNIEIVQDISLIAVVGHTLSEEINAIARVSSALAKNNIRIRMINYGASKLNIIVAVDTQNFENAIKVLYDEFFK
ncbi:MAG: aspartate kinase [Firmicutes bacterium]|nr:aspartate kinase [Bacillota bacterium]